MTAEAYSAGASSQTKWPASMITRRLVGRRSSRNSALASGRSRSAGRAPGARWLGPTAPTRAGRPQSGKPTLGPCAVSRDSACAIEPCVRQSQMAGGGRQDRAGFAPRLDVAPSSARLLVVSRRG
jgi:hypothetical protein